MDDGAMRALNTEIRCHVLSYPAVYRAFFVGRQCTSPHLVSVAVDFYTPGQITLKDLLIHHWMAPGPLYSRDRVCVGSWVTCTLTTEPGTDNTLPNAYTILTNNQTTASEVNHIVLYESDDECHWNGNILVIKHSGPASTSAPTHFRDTDYSFTMNLVIRLLKQISEAAIAARSVVPVAGTLTAIRGKGSVESCDDIMEDDS
ncbi:hypothetical protein AURDEDRAFT_161510 [Auricularia subglabra TFB-10046 SS5]|nr:hypothetical protein AURDEDRAFT_161510 [Auricularia subglabra TFB-10046 SS5]